MRCWLRRRVVDLVLPWPAAAPHRALGLAERGPRDGEAGSLLQRRIDASDGKTEPGIPWRDEAMRATRAQVVILVSSRHGDLHRDGPGQVRRHGAHCQWFPGSVADMVWIPIDSRSGALGRQRDDEATRCLGGSYPTGQAVTAYRSSRRSAARGTPPSRSAGREKPERPSRRPQCVDQSVSQGGPTRIRKCGEKTGT